ncbi:S1 family peptidase [Kitasatospora sp. McL0602]|uniref:S1 family peptidase n=1 Tax=Kitasatospora sp. McL0602 TaxID=3439530 RepID=UPI003F890083
MLTKTSRSAWTAGLLATAVAAGVLTIGSGSPASAVSGDTPTSYAFTAKLEIDTGGTKNDADKRACTGALVDPNWVITAASCFVADPSKGIAVPAGAPKGAVTVTVGRADLTTGAGQVTTVTELVPRPDRDLVLAKLAKPVTGIAPITIAATAPTAGETLKVTGYGRTKDQWVPNKLHADDFTVGTETDTTLNLSPTAGTSSAICQGDAGGPAFRTTNGQVELAAINSRSWQGGCYASPETRTGAVESRVDDLGPWLHQLGVQYAASGYTPVPPVRVLDSRTAGSSGRTWAVNQGGGEKVLKLGAGNPGPIQLPQGSTAVVLNVTVVNPTNAGFLAVEPSDTSRPTSSAINFTTGQTAANLVTAPVGPDGTVYLWTNTNNLDVLVDVFGYYNPKSANRFTPRSPIRLLDTRTNSTTLSGGSSIDVQVAGQNGVPADATAAVLNLTSTRSTTGGVFVVYPSGTTRPSTSNLNFTAGQTISNQIIVPIGKDGKISVYNHVGNADAIVDLSGWYSPTGSDLFHPLTPLRLVDTRQTPGTPINAGQFIGITGAPLGADATVMNVATVQPTAAGYFTLYPHGIDRPTTSNLNFAPGVILANHVTVPVGQNNQVDLFNFSGQSHAVADLYGYFTKA